MKWFYNLKISVKLITGFAIVALLACAVGLTGIINMKTLDDNDTALYEKNAIPLALIGNISAEYQKLRIYTRDAVFNTANNDKKSYKTKADQSIEDIKSDISAYEKAIETESERKIWSDLNAQITEYSQLKDHIFEHVFLGEINEAVNIIYSTDAARIATSVQTSVDELFKVNIDGAKEKSDGNTVAANKIISIMIIVLIAAMVVAIGLGLFISNIISKPINKIVGVANKIADGDLDVSIEADTRDETGILAQSFGKMAENLNDAMMNINSSAEQVATGSNQVSMSGQALSQGSTEQASSIEEITSSMTQVAVQTKQNATNANQANELAILAKNNASSGNQQMQEMLKAMTEINDSSANISKIIKVIDDIAFQTNILALNAAVEAARAGQHGKGFAVVAEEVRNLAARSANAAKETTAMIEGSIKKVDMGTKIANETAQALNKIVDDVAKAADIVGGIAIASNEQATAIAQVNVAIEQVSQVVQTNSATAEESAAASEELSEQARMLKDVVSNFKLRRSKSINGMSFDRMNPEMMKMLEGMMDKKNKSGPAINSHEAAPSIERKTRINLTDNEFGKY